MRRRRIQLHRSCLVAGLVLLLACALPAAAPAGEVGVNVGGPVTGGDAGAAGARYLERLKPGWVREWLWWSSTEPAPGVVHDDVLTRLGSGAAARQADGIKTDVVIVGAPQWASGSSDPLTPPADPAAMAAFVAKVAGHPAVRGHIGAYEIWNEEDAPLWDARRAEPGPVRRDAARCHPAIKSADPSAAVLVGGLTGNDYVYLDQLYANGIHGAFDGVAVHTDTACLTNAPSAWARDAGTGRVSQFSFTGYRELYRSMVANGDGDKGIWMTELG